MSEPSVDPVADEPLLALPDETWWADPGPYVRNFMTDAVLENRPGIYLAGPGFVPVRGPETLPVAGCAVLTLRDARGMALRDLAVLTAINLETNKVYAARAFPPAAESEASVVLGAEDPGEGLAGTHFAFDLYELFNLPRATGTYLVRLLARSWQSNALRVYLGTAPYEFEDAAVTRYLADRLRQAAPRPVAPAPGVPLPSYQPVAESPHLPAAPGIALSARRVVPLDDRQAAVVAGAFRLRALPHEVLRTPAERERNRGATAVVAIALVVLGSDTAGPRFYRLRVPSFDPVEPGAERPEVTGYFAVDLLAMPDMWREPRTLFVYALSGTHVGGPALMGIVGAHAVATLDD